jgi:hypothetical protein
LFGHGTLNITISGGDEDTRGVQAMTRPRAAAPAMTPAAGAARPARLAVRGA